MATNPMEREGCWLCAGSGEIETRKADQSYDEVTVGCPVCVQNDEQWEREKVERERDALAAHVELARYKFIDMVKLTGPHGDPMIEREKLNEFDSFIRRDLTGTGTSLARLKAQWQAEILEVAKSKIIEDPHGDPVAKLEYMAYRMRRQADFSTWPPGNAAEQHMAYRMRSQAEVGDS